MNNKKTWTCSECKKVHADTHLFCGSAHDLKPCSGKHPDYWEKTKHRALEALLHSTIQNKPDWIDTLRSRPI